MIFDSHAHYDSAEYDTDREELLERLPAGGIGGVVNAASSKASVDACLSLASRYPYLHAAVGIHPENLLELKAGDEDWLREKIREPGVVAVGEIGLDYHWDTVPRTLQKEWFVRQLQMAAEEGMPVVVHSRDAAADTLSLMREYYGARPAYLHCFSYGRQMAEEFLRLGYLFGIGGVVTFKNARKIVEALEVIPMEHILLETDSPYLSPAPYRGQRNTSLRLPLVIDRIASLKGLAYEEAERITWDNAVRYFGLQEGAAEDGLYPTHRADCEVGYDK